MRFWTKAPVASTSEWRHCSPEKHTWTGRFDTKSSPRTWKGSPVMTVGVGMPYCQQLRVGLPPGIRASEPVVSPAAAAPRHTSAASTTCKNARLIAHSRPDWYASLQAGVGSVEKLEPQAGMGLLCEQASAGSANAQV